MPLTDNLGFYAKLDEPTGFTRTDLASGYDLADHGTVALGAGKLNGCAVFDGTARWLTTPTQAALNLDGDITIGVWVWLDGGNTDAGTIVGKWGDTSLEYILQCDNSNGQFLFAIDLNGSVQILHASTFGTAALNTWHYVTCGYDSANNLFWVAVNDGARDTMATSGAPTAGRAQGFTLGQNDGGGGSQRHRGRIDDVAVWKRVLSTGEVATIWNGGAGMELMPTPPPVAALVLVTTQPPTQVIQGIGFGLAVSVESADGRLVTDYVGNVTVALDANPGSATLGGTLTVAASGGVATFTDLTLDVVDTGYTLQATSAALTPDTSDAVEVLPALTTGQLAFWPVDEAPGSTRVDRVNGYDLADVLGNVGRDAGKIHRAASFTPALTPALSVASNADLQLLGTRSFACWLYLNSATPAGIMGKWSTLDAGQEYILVYDGTRFRFDIRIGGSLASIHANTFGLPALATWHLVTFGYDFDTQSLWIAVNDGARDAVTASGTIAAGDAPFVLGSVADAFSYFDGRIDEAGVWGRTLSAVDQAALYNGGAGRELFAALPATMLAVITQPTVVVKNTPFTLEINAESAGGALDTGYSGDVTVAFGANPGGATLGGTLTVAAVDGIATFADLTIDVNDVGYTLAATSGALTGATSAAIEVTSQLLYQLVTYWDLDQATGATRTDAVGGHDLTDHNNVALGTGVIGGAAAFDGTNWLAAADAADLRLDGDITIAGWVKVSSGAVDAVQVVGKLGTAALEYALDHFFDVKRFRGYFSPDGTTFQFVQSDRHGDIADDTWYFVATGRDATNQRIWISINAGTPDFVASPGTPPGNLTAGLGVGAQASGAQPFRGDQDALGIWKRVLTPSDLASLYNGGDGLAHPFTGTVRPLAIFSADTIHQGGTGTLTVVWLASEGGVDTLVTPSDPGFVFSPTSQTLPAGGASTIEFSATADVAATLGAHALALANDGGYAIADVPVTVVLPEYALRSVEIDASYEANRTGGFIDFHIQNHDGSDLVGGITRFGLGGVLTVDGVPYALDNDLYAQYQGGTGPDDKPDAHLYYTLGADIELGPDSVVTWSCPDDTFGNVAGSTGIMTDVPVPVRTIAEYWPDTRTQRAETNGLYLGYNTAGDSTGTPFRANLAQYMGLWGFVSGGVVVGHGTIGNRGNLTSVTDGYAGRILWDYNTPFQTGTYCVVYREVEGATTIGFTGDNMAVTGITPVASPPAGKVGFICTITGPNPSGRLGMSTTKAIDQMEIYGPEVMTGLSDYPAGVKRINPRVAVHYAGKNVYMLRDLNISRAGTDFSDFAQPDVDRINAQYFGNAYGDDSNVKLHVVSLGPVPEPYLSEWHVAGNASFTLVECTTDADLPAALASETSFYWSWTDINGAGVTPPADMANTYGGTSRLGANLFVFVRTGARTFLTQASTITAPTVGGSPLTLAGTTAVDTYLSYSFGLGLPWQDEIDYANAMGVQALYIRVNVTYSDQCITDIIDFLNRPFVEGEEGGGLRPGVELYMEEENEVWNFPPSPIGFQMGFLAQHAQYLFDHDDPDTPIRPADGFQYVAMRAARHFEVARPLCVAAGRPFYSVLGVQGGFAARVDADFLSVFDQLITLDPSVSPPDYFVSAPYFDLVMYKATAAFWDRLSPDAVITLNRNQLVSAMGNSGYFQAHQDIIDASTHCTGVAQACYEGIFETIIGVSSNFFADADAANMSGQMYHAAQCAYSHLERSIPDVAGRKKFLDIFQDMGNSNYRGFVWYDARDLTQEAGLGAGQSPRFQAFADWMAGTPTPTPTPTPTAFFRVNFDGGYTS